MATTVVFPSSLAVTGPIHIVGGGSGATSSFSTPSFSTGSGQYAIVSCASTSVIINGNTLTGISTVYIPPSTNVGFSNSIGYATWVIFGNT